MNLKKNILRIFSANFISMISATLIGFVIPIILSVESYSYLQTYMFYISYIGFLHFGFIDGMYIKYGGKECDEVDRGELKGEHIVFNFIQIIITLLFIVISIINRDVILIIMAFSIIPINTISFHKLFYQATGQFRNYANISYIYTIIYLAFNLILVFVFRSENYIYYCIASLLANSIVWIILEIKFYKNIKDVKFKYSKEVWNNIKIGFWVLLGNFSVILFYAIDRWFIKIFFDVDTFAYYSFAISILKVVNLLISAISITFYNYLSKGENIEKIKKMKLYFIFLGVIASGAYFVFAAIISIFLKKYTPSLSIISISFSAYPYMIIINTLYINLYKSRKEEKKYFNVVVKMVVISAIYNAIALIISKTPEAIAIATTLSFITWYIYSIKDFEYLKSSKKEIIYLGISMLSFLLLANYLNWFIGGVTYLLVVLSLTLIVYRKDVEQIVNLILKR